MTRAKVTAHAIDRGVERLGWRRRDAAQRLRQAWLRSVPVPKRVLYQLGGLRSFSRRKGEAKYRVSGGTVLVVHGRTIVTVWPLDLDAIAGLMVWIAMGICPPD